MLARSARNEYVKEIETTEEEEMTIRSAPVMISLAVFCLALPAFAQQSKAVTKRPIVVIREYKHDTGPLLREIAPLFPEFGTPGEREIENPLNPNHPWSTNKFQKDPVLQTAENSPTLQTPTLNGQFDG